MSDTPRTPIPTPPPPEAEFRWRGQDVSRLEGLSDAVFALALTLLALDAVPDVLADVERIFLEIPALAASFAILVMIWHSHYLYFRRYGLRDATTVWLNGVLLFLVLLYAYPLRFLFELLFDLIGSGFSEPPRNRFEAFMLDMNQPYKPQMTRLMMIYGGGYAAIFGTLALLYRHALKLRERLGLDPLEELITRHAIRTSVIQLAFGITSAVLAIWIHGMAGAVYFGVGFVIWWDNAVFTRRRRALGGGP